MTANRTIVRLQYVKPGRIAGPAAPSLPPPGPGRARLGPSLGYWPRTPRERGGIVIVTNKSGASRVCPPHAVTLSMDKRCRTADCRSSLPTLSCLYPVRGWQQSDVAAWSHRLSTTHSAARHTRRVPGVPGSVKRRVFNRGRDLMPRRRTRASERTAWPLCTQRDPPAARPCPCRALRERA